MAMRERRRDVSVSIGIPTCMRDSRYMGGANEEATMNSRLFT